MLRDKSIVINSASVGWGSQTNQSRFTMDELGLLPPAGFEFHVGYQPGPPELLVDARALNLRTLSGTRMNLLQAVLAFCLSIPNSKREIVMESMLNSVN